MPKAFGVNSKAAEAKAREQEKKRNEAEKKQKEAEDAHWRDDDKHASKKLERKEEKQRKHEEEVRRREENRKLLEMESQQLKASASAKAKAAAPPKITRAQVDANREKLEAEEKQRLGLPSGPQPAQPTASAPAKQSNRKRNDSNGDSDDSGPPIEENINRLLTLNDADGTARNVDQAIALLGAEEGDLHPERRMKKAHLEFEERMMAKLKAEFPTYKRSQLKEIIWREWQRAPENPLNKAAKAANLKSSIQNDANEAE